MKKYLLLFLSFAFFLSAERSILFLNDTSAHYHWGCTGTSLALKEEMRDLGYSVEGVSIHELWAMNGVPQEVDLFDCMESFETFKKSNRELVKKILASDVIVINGEGSIHSDRPYPKSLLYVAYISKKILNKHVQIINHSCFPEDTTTVKNQKIKELYSKVYQVLDYVSVREPLSQEALRSMGIDAELSFDSMPLYIKKHYQFKPAKKKEKTIVLAGSVAWQEGGVRAIVSELKTWEKRGYRIQVLVGAKAKPSLDDDFFVELLQNKLKCDWEIVEAKSFDEWLDTIAGADFLVSGRFHHTIAAICLKTPFVIFNSNTPKIEGMLSIMPKPMPVLRYHDPQLECKLRESIAYAQSMKESDFPALEDVCQLALKKFSELKRLESQAEALTL